MSIKEVGNKNWVGWIGVAITLLTGWVTLNNKVSANELRVQNAEKKIERIEEINTDIPKQISDLKIELLKELTEIKIQLKDKEDRK